MAPFMEIGNIFKAKEPATPSEHFLAIQIQEGIVKTAVWQVSSGQPEVTSYGSLQEWTDTESLVVAVDASLTTALEGQELEPDRVIFGLPESWVKDDKISPDASVHLKELIHKLELKPIGFVVITEAVIQQLKLNEGIPPTAILLELHSSKVNVVVTKLGEVVGREEVGRSDDLAKDVQEGLARLEIDQFPARIIIINGQDTDIEQQLTSFPWKEQLPFLHIPKVETPDPKFSIKAVALSGGSEAARSLGIEVQEPETAGSPGGAVPDSDESDSDPDSGDLGFVVGQDIRDLDTPESDMSEPAPIVPSAPIKRPKFAVPAALTNLKSFIPRFNQSSFSQPQFNFKNPLFIAIPVILLLIIFGIVFAYGSISSAKITLFVEPKQLDKSFELAIADSPQDDLPTIPATSESLELNASGSIPTSGEALVGDKATGEVTVFNKTDSEKTFEKGTTLTTSGNLKFVLDSDVTVASRSAEEQDGGINIVYGKVTTSVTANAIGAESNIDNNTEFTVGTFPKSSIDAKATKDFSGGTSRTVKAVSKTDRQELLDQLSEQIKSEAKDKLSSSDEFQIVPQDVEIIDQSFSDAVGDETDTLSLDLKAKANFLKFRQSALSSLVELQINSDIPPGFTFNPDNADITVSPPETDDDGLITTTATVKANLTPDVPISDYQKQLKGKSVNTADRLLQNIAGYKKLTIIITPKLPFLSGRLPSNTDKIQFEIKPITP